MIDAEQPDRDNKETNSFTNWYIVTEQLYTIYHSFLSYVSTVNRLEAAGLIHKTRDSKIGAMGDLFKLYHFSISTGAFPKKIDEKDKKKMLRIASGDSIPTKDDLNWACTQLTLWYGQTGSLNIKVPPKKKYDGVNAMAEGYGSRY